MQLWNIKQVILVNIYFRKRSLIARFCFLSSFDFLGVKMYCILLIVSLFTGYCFALCSSLLFYFSNHWTVHSLKITINYLVFVIWTAHMICLDNWNDHVTCWICSSIEHMPVNIQFKKKKNVTRSFGSPNKSCK